MSTIPISQSSGGGDVSGSFFSSLPVKVLEMQQNINTYHNFLELLGANWSQPLVQVNESLWKNFHSGSRIGGRGAAGRGVHDDGCGRRRIQ